MTLFYRKSSAARLGPADARWRMPAGPGRGGGRKGSRLLTAAPAPATLRRASQHTYLRDLGQN